MRGLKARTAASPPSLALLIDREVTALDALASEISLGVRGPRHFDQLEEQASAIGDRLRAAFRNRV